VQKAGVIIGKIYISCQRAHGGIHFNQDTNSRMQMHPCDLFKTHI